jgi:hypothetical protein
MLAPASPVTSPATRLVKRHPGYYLTADGRYSLRAGHGWFQDTWTLYDHATTLATTHHGKREALAALRVRQARGDERRAS